MKQLLIENQRRNQNILWQNVSNETTEDSRKCDAHKRYTIAV